MLSIALVDDDKKDRSHLENILYEICDKCGEDFNIKAFQSGEEICKSFKDNTYDLIFLDIEMEGINGIETLKEIKKAGLESYIIFVSAYDERIKELFADKVIAFISKPVGVKELQEKIKFVLDKLSSKEVFSYKKNGKINIVSLSDIIYFESKLHYVVIKTKSQEISFKGKISDVWDKLKDNYLFTMPHRSYVVNFNYIKFASRTKMELNSEKNERILISIGKNYKDNTEYKFIKFINRIGNRDG